LFLPPDTEIVFACGLHPILGDSSVSIEHRDYVMGLIGLGAPVSVLELRPNLNQSKGISLTPEDERRIKPLCYATSSHVRDVVCIVSAYDFYQVDGATWKNLIYQQLKERFPRLRRVVWVVRAITETTHFSLRYMLGLPHYDDVWVPSAFHLQHFKACGIAPNKLHKIPEAIDVKLWREATCLPRLLIPSRREFAFVTISRYSIDIPGRVPTWNQARKAIPLLLQAFTEEFSPDENVCLVIKGAGRAEGEGQQIADWLQKLGRSSNGSQVIALGGPMSQRSVAALIAQADAFVGVARGEGWGRALAEAMLLGKPTIGTRFGGNTEFMSDDNSYLVECSLVPVGAILPGTCFGYWAEPSLASYRKTLREVFLNSRTNSDKTGAAMAQISRHYNRQAVGEMIVSRVTYLLGRPECALS
jgi:glycosyltransferase involved in cell wall biosynthesis